MEPRLKVSYDTKVTLSQLVFGRLEEVGVRWCSRSFSSKVSLKSLRIVIFGLFSDLDDVNGPDMGVPIS